jgi:hypothetical protein
MLIYIMINLPKDFNTVLYKNINSDLINLNNEELELHYLNFGIKENRIYKYISPHNFNPTIYKNLNNDLYNLTDDELKIHYMKYGINENRIYNYILPHNFNPTIYKNLNNDLYNLTDDELKIHYMKYGINENRIYKYILPYNFNPTIYKNLNNDLYNLTDDELKIHYMKYGINENRLFSNELISIIIGYYNRKEQIINTLNQFTKLYKLYNIEVIIIDDNSDNENKLEDIIKNYSFNIKLIKIIFKNYINPVIAYNIGFAHSNGNIIIIQNAEILHCNDIIKYILNNINDNVYLTFPVFSSPHFNYNNKIVELCNNNKDIYNEFIEKINYTDFDFDYNFYITKYSDINNLNYDDAYNHWLNIGIYENRECNKFNIFYRKNVIYEWKGWYNHIIHNKRDLHFLSAITKNTLNKIGGFCNEFKDGYWYDDDDFKYRIEKVAKIITVDTNYYIGIHLYHKSGSDDQHLNKDFGNLILKNKAIYDYNKNNNIIYCNPILDNINFKIFNNKINIGLFIKTYSDKDTTTERINIIEDLFISLKENINNDIIKILIVDKIYNEYHKKIINKYSSIFNEIIYNKSNKGIGATTNIGIKKLIYNYNIDIGFACDDDIIIHKNCIEKYSNTILNSDIEHFTYYPYKELLEENIIHETSINQNIYKDDILYGKFGIAGCFFTFTKKMILKNGYLPILPYKYGYEHEIFTFNNLKKEGFYDLVSCNSLISNSNIYVSLNKKSIKNKSFIPDYNECNKNLLESKKYENNYKYINFNDLTEKINIIIYYENIEITQKYIDSIVKTKYLNYEIIIIINKQINNTDKNELEYITYNNLYIKYIYDEIDNIINNINEKIYIINNINYNNNNNNNNNIYIINDIDEINEFFN